MSHPVLYSRGRRSGRRHTLMLYRSYRRSCRAGRWRSDIPNAAISPLFIAASKSTSARSRHNRLRRSLRCGDSKLRDWWPSYSFSFWRRCTLRPLRVSRPHCRRRACICIDASKSTYIIRARPRFSSRLAAWLDAFHAASECCFSDGLFGLCARGVPLVYRSAHFEDKWASVSPVRKE